MRLRQNLPTMGGVGLLAAVPPEVHLHHPDDYFERCQQTHASR
jgi:hypothetical protein